MKIDLQKKAHDISIGDIIVFRSSSNLGPCTAIHNWLVISTHASEKLGFLCLDSSAVATSKLVSKTEDIIEAIAVDMDERLCSSIEVLEVIANKDLVLTRKY